MDMETDFAKAVIIDGQTYKCVKLYVIIPYPPE
jgi:hypothetical protein